MGEILAIIPARLGSTRFPEKVLAARTGQPLIQHVWEAARGARSLQRVVIATDHPRVLQAAANFGAEVVMTSPDHPNGTSRLAEAARTLRLRDDAIVVNVQGDEPELEAGAIDALVACAAKTKAEVSTLASPLAERSPDRANPNVVKVALAMDGSAMYCSRSLIPFPRNNAHAAALRHVGMYAYRAAFLQTYLTLAPTPCEQAESLEQLRVLEHGYRIAVAVHACESAGIDTPEQYEAFVERVKGRRG